VKASRRDAARIVALACAVLSLCAVLCFRFPEQLTTPSLRAVYPLPLVRVVLRVTLALSFALGALDLALRPRVIGAPALMLALVSLALLLGGAGVPTRSVASSSYVGLDWFVVDILLMSALFTPMERLFPTHPEQPVLRAGWKTDLAYFLFGHLLVQVTTFLTIAPGRILFAWAAAPGLQRAVAAQPMVLQFVEIMLVADCTHYAVHRLAHRVPLFWRVHSIHHSCEKLDWLAGSRIHILDAVVTRASIFLPIFVLGFSSDATLAYLAFVAVHAVFLHANVRFRFGRLERIFVTPRLHHWHHASAPEAIDKNFALHFSWLDRLFKTAYAPPPPSAEAGEAEAQAEAWPQGYGLAS
jgi:sterol desaturase/sphingolipid hydroxylase (fatty acid hydroxylase superfamily)